MNGDTAIGAVLCDDLLLGSKVTAAARALGLDVRLCRSLSDLRKLAAEQALRCVMLDLHHAGLNLAELLPALRARGKPAVVGFGSHVATATLQGAEQAGCDLVLPRSRFFADLDTTLPMWMG
jgi:hypothetical protein